jgi:sphingomyelin phosphodiesterase
VWFQCPAFRVYSVDPITFAILDYTVYYANISSPAYQTGPIWEELYSVKDAYGRLVSPPVTDPSAELTPAFWHDLTVLFESNDEIYQTWYARRGRDFSNSTCTGACKTSSICGLRASQSQYNWFVFSQDSKPLPALPFEVDPDNAQVALYRPVLTSSAKS